MTAEEEAIRGYGERIHLRDEDVDYLLEVMAVAVAEEREACAKIARDKGTYAKKWADWTAADKRADEIERAIRARGQPASW